MWNITMYSEDSSSDSGSDTSSERSLSPSPPSLTYSSSFANPISIPLKSRLSPPSTTSAGLSLSPKTPPSSSVSPHTVLCAYPSWPAGDFLSAKASSFGHISAGKDNQPSSRISDEDLLDLEELDLYCGMRVPTGMSLVPADIPWEATKQPPPVVFSAPKRPSIGGKKKTRRSSALHRARSMRAMSPIAEVPE
ncbi:MAG: hypothetical protein Q9178_007016 [Gyalolechia marmorata]